MPVKIGVMVSGRGSNLEAIIDSIESGRVRNAVIRVVMSNRPGARALEVARSHGIEAAIIDQRGYKGRRAEHDRRVMGCLKEHGVTHEEGLVLLAGYDRILGPEFVQEFRGRIMNIHPALLPSFPGLDAQRRALECGVKVSGCTVHFVDENVDGGPIILQAAVPVMEGDTAESLAERILMEEHRIYPEAVRLFVEGRLKLEGRRVRIT